MARSFRNIASLVLLLAASIATVRAQAQPNHRDLSNADKALQDRITIELETDSILKKYDVRAVT